MLALHLCNKLLLVLLSLLSRQLVFLVSSKTFLLAIALSLFAFLRQPYLLCRFFAIGLVPTVLFILPALLLLSLVIRLFVGQGHLSASCQIVAELCSLLLGTFIHYPLPLDCR